MNKQDERHLDLVYATAEAIKEADQYVCFRNEMDALRDSKCTADVIAIAYSYFDEDTDAWTEAVEALDDWDGTLGDSRCYEMYMLDEIFGHLSISEFVEIMDSHFDHDDNFFYVDGWGEVCTTDDKAENYIDYLERCNVKSILEDYDQLGLDNVLLKACACRYAELSYEEHEAITKAKGESK